MPDLKKCSEIMIKEIYRVFGFIAACGENMFNKYDKVMPKYEYLYYCNNKFVNKDFSLLKYLLTIKENAKYLSFKKLSYFSNFEKSHETISRNILSPGYLYTPEHWMKFYDPTDYLPFENRIFSIFLKFLRNNTCFIWNLNSGYFILKFNRIKDVLVEDILQKDINNFMELTNELIINQILIKNSSATFEEISDGILLCLKNFFGEKYIKDIIFSLTTQKATEDGIVNFSLKDDIFPFVDLNYILYPSFETKIKKYLTDLKKVSAFNIYLYPVNKYESKLIEDNYNQFYSDSENLDFLFSYTQFILANEGCEILIENFLSTLLNYIATFLSIETEQIISLREKLETNLLEVLENNNLTDENKKSFCKFIAQK